MNYANFFLVFVVNQGQNSVLFVVNQGQNEAEFVVNQGQDEAYINDVIYNSSKAFAAIGCFTKFTSMRWSSITFFQQE